MKKKVLLAIAIVLAVILLLEIGYLIKRSTEEESPNPSEGTSALEPDKPQQGTAGQANGNTEGVPAGTGSDDTTPGVSVDDATSADPSNDATSGGDTQDAPQGGSTEQTQPPETRPGGLEEDELPAMPV